MELMQKLYNFYSGRYSGTELEKKFNDACEQLIKVRDIDQKEYINFCIDNDIEPIIREVPKKPARSSGYSSIRGC